MTADPAPLASIIVAAYHSADFLPRCLESLIGQTLQNFEIIVVNSSPETRTAAVLSTFPAVRFHQHPERLLPHAARNVGAEMARGRLLVFTDADCRAEPGWLAALAESQAAGHELVGGVIETAAPHLVSRAIHLLKYFAYLRGRPAGPFDLAATGSMLASQAAWRLAGPFDGSLFAGDALFSSRALRAGITPWFEPRAVVVDQDEKLPSGFFGDRLRRGQEFGKMRAEFAHWTRPQLAMRSALAPVALAFTLGRMFHQCRRAGRLTDFAVTFPFQLAAQAAWCFGEALGYAELSQKAIPGDRPTL